MSTNVISSSQSIIVDPFQYLNAKKIVKKRKKIADGPSKDRRQYRINLDDKGTYDWIVTTDNGIYVKRGCKNNPEGFKNILIFRQTDCS